MQTCADLGCDRDYGCCVTSETGIPYCRVQSQCKANPLWEAIVIPAVLFLFAVIIIIIVWCKLSNARKSTMKVNNFARQQIGNAQKKSEGRLETMTSIV